MRLIGITLVFSFLARSAQADTAEPLACGTPPHERASFSDVKSVPAGTLIASANGLLRLEAGLSRATPVVQPIRGIAVSADRRSVAAVGKGRMLLSKDGGQTFREVALPEKTDFFAAAWSDENLFVFSTSGNGYLITPDGTVGGLQLPVSATWFGATFKDERRGYVIGMNPSILLTTGDGGTTWTQHSAPTTPSGVASLSGALLVSAENGVFRSTDEGASFTKVLDASHCTRMDSRNGIVAVGCRSATPKVSDEIYSSADGLLFQPAHAESLRGVMSVAIDDNRELIEVSLHPAVMRGGPGHMKLVYESRQAQAERISFRESEAGVGFTRLPSARSDRGTVMPARQPLSPRQRQLLLEESIPMELRGFSGSLEAFGKDVFAVAGIDVYSPSGRMGWSDLKRVCAREGTTWRQCFEEISVQTHSHFFYDAEIDAWTFSAPPVSAYYGLTAPADWNVVEEDDLTTYSFQGAALVISPPEPYPASTLTPQNRKEIVRGMGEIPRGMGANSSETTGKQQRAAVTQKPVQIDGVSGVVFDVPAKRTRDWMLIKDGYLFQIFARYSNVSDEVIETMTRIVESSHLRTPSQVR